MVNKSYIIYDGPSQIDGLPIVAIAQVKSGNRKTGDMVQTWILRSDIDPITASRTGADSSICGDCIHKGKPSNKATGWAKDRTCYVNLLFAPNGVFKAYQRGAYEVAQGHDAIRAIGLLRGVRLGSYGDPCAVPNYIWESLTSGADFVTAYTHGAINPMPQTIMTSADNATQARNAWDKGERTFRVVSALDQLIKGKEVLCPASDEAGNRATCASCKLCGGNSVKAKSVAIVAHGASKRKAKQMIKESV
tara:strand:+ start:1320 stop:2066 length:747 start_codon:yes stop_codon:yes gene_type:complete